jgi:hypothetical protein
MLIHCLDITVSGNVKWRNLETSADFIEAVTDFTNKVFEHEAIRRKEVGASIFFLFFVFCFLFFAYCFLFLFFVFVFVFFDFFDFLIF